MIQTKHAGERIFDVLIYSVMILLAASCILPIIHVLAISFSGKDAAMGGMVALWPVKFTTMSYTYILEKPDFLRSLVISLERIAVGIPINMLLIVITAYPLSKRPSDFRGRTVYVWFFVFTMLFSGGLIPVYMTIKTLGLIDSFWALILPGAVQVWNIILMLNFFRSLPRALEEAAFIDGAGHFTVLWKIYFPLSAPAMATVGLFVMVGHWNSWFDGLIFMNSPAKYPLQTYIQTIIASVTTIGTGTFDGENWKRYSVISDKTVKASQIFLAALPILVVYPFLQKYFMSGIVLGSVKE
jgi:putative aldouronate transport system permease protein